MGAFLSSVVLKWWLRRLMELGGIVGAGLAAWNGLDPVAQGVILALLSRNWDTITLGSPIPIAISLWGYVWSFISSNRNQVVVDGQQVAMKEIPQQTVVEELSRTAIERRGETLIEKALKMKWGRKN